MNTSRRFPTALTGAMLTFVALCAGDALAQAAKRDNPVPAAPAAVAPAASNGAPSVVTSTADVQGFRSARFGMSENDVRAAIAKDFAVKPDAIKEDTNKSEQTHILSIKVPDVLPGGGLADVSYVFGFKSKTLIQVGLSWSKAIDDKMTPEQLFSNATVLRSHFLSAGYKPDTIATNMPISGGLLMFRGSDAKDHSTLLILQGTMAQGENEQQRVLTPTGLLLFYIVDAKAPDVYRLPAGSF
jgi:hypothetical protein